MPPLQADVADFGSPRLVLCVGIAGLITDRHVIPEPQDSEVDVKRQKVLAIEFRRRH